MSGWGLFILENVILSENRATIIKWLDDDAQESKYHALYGTCSTLATATIVYSFMKCRNAAAKGPLMIPGRGRILGAVALQAAGFVGLAQMAPKMQIPIGSGKEGKLKVMCPFDFTPSGPEGGIVGIERVSRHPMLWSMAFVGLGQSIMAPTMPLAVWYAMPTAVALIGGSHHDSRFRRGIGGTLSEERDKRTSNIPFLGMITGDQRQDGGVGGAFTALGAEMKPLNIGAGVLVALGLASRRVLRLR